MRTRAALGSPFRAWAAGRRRRRAPQRAHRGLALVACLAATVAVAGCRQDMHQAPRYDPLERSDFFPDQRASRPLVEHTVARGQLRADKALYTGKVDGVFVKRIPVPVTRAMLLRGRERFDIYCSPCHSRLGDGNGMIVQRGLKRPPSFDEQVLRTQPDGYLYDVISNGFGAMQDYSAQIPPADRWAVVAYVRALQFARRAPVTVLTDDDRARLDKGPEAGAPREGGASTHE